jgi:PAS domain-containing protein
MSNPDERDTRLKLAVEQAGLATWDVDLASGQAIWSESFFRLLGYPVDPSGRATYEMWYACLHPDDRGNVIAALKRAEQERTLFRCEHRALRADTGELLWLEPLGRFDYDANGRATNLAGNDRAQAGRRAPSQARDTARPRDAHRRAGCVRARSHPQPPVLVR